jgi:L1 cell adhesion molecule like protein
MVNEAEKYKADDDKQREKVASKNNLENYCFSMKNSLNDLGDKIDSSDKDAITKAVDEALQWLDSNQMAEKDEFDSKREELEAVINPIMTKVHQGGAGGCGAQTGMPQGGNPYAGGMPGGMPGAYPQGQPAGGMDGNIPEVD